MLRRQAAGWLARLQSGRGTDIERKFRRWYDSDPANAAAFDRVSRSYEQAGLLRNLPIAPEKSAVDRHQSHRAMPRFAIAAGIAVAVLVPAGVLLSRGPDISLATTEAVMLATRVGEIRQVKLEDGSRLTLDTNTSVEVRVGRSRRAVRLEHGRARFEIAAAREPFVVHSRSTIVTTAQGTVDIDDSTGQTRVAVLAGSARVSRSGQGAPAVSLGAGEAILAAPNGVATRHEVSGGGPDWIRGMVQFDGTPLAEAVALANRYSERHILIGDDVDRLRVTGAFRAGDTAGLAKALAAAFKLSLVQRPDGNLVLSRMEPDPPEKKNGG